MTMVTINLKCDNATSSFKEWMRNINSALLKIVGITSSDLPDRLWRDEYDDGSTVEEIIDEVMEEIEDGSLA